MGFLRRMGFPPAHKQPVCRTVIRWCTLLPAITNFAAGHSRESNRDCLAPQFLVRVRMGVTRVVVRFVALLSQIARLNTDLGGQKLGDFQEAVRGR